MLDDIEKYLGELKGNEWFWDRLEEESTVWDDYLAEPQRAPGLVTTNSASFSVPGTYPFVMPHDYVENADVYRPKAFGRDPVPDLQREAKEQWNLGVSWAEGSASIFRSLSRDVWEPDAAALRRAAMSLDGVVGFLLDHVDDRTPAFVNKLKKSWPATSLGSESFYDFWEDQADLCAQYHIGAERLAVMVACTANPIEQYQENLYDVAVSTRDGLIKALEQWQWFHNPVGRRSGPLIDKPADDIFEGIGFAGDLLSFVPGPVGKGAGATSVVSSILAFTFQDKHKVEEFEITGAGEIRLEFRSATEKAPQELKKALDKLRSSPKTGNGGVSFPAFAKKCANNPNWKPTPVDIST